MSSAADYGQTDIAVQLQRARRAARELAHLSAEQRGQILLAAADLLQAREAEILKANREDCEALEREIRAGGASPALLRRLKTSSVGVEGLARHQDRERTGVKRRR